MYVIYVAFANQKQIGVLGGDKKKKKVGKVSSDLDINRGFLYNF